MKANLNSIFQRPAKAFLLVALLVGSLLGTHWQGYQHRIAHDQSTSHTPDFVAHGADHSHAVSTGTSHLKVSCLLFDALTLAGFATSSTATLAKGLPPFHELSPYSSAINPTAALRSYQSQAPPTSIQL